MNVQSSKEPERKYPKWEAQRQLIAATIANFKLAEKALFAHLQLELGPWNEWPHGIATMLLSNTTLKYRERRCSCRGRSRRCTSATLRT